MTDSGMPETVLLVETPEAEPLIGPWRARHDPVADRGVPAHVTALFPFVAPEAFAASTLEELGVVAAGITPFDYELTSVDEFPGVVWLRPEPDDPFRRLTARLWAAAFPDHPPYESRFPDSQPHVTIAHTEPGPPQDRLCGEVTAAIESHLPLRGRAEQLSVFMSDEAGTWHRRHTLPLRG